MKTKRLSVAEAKKFMRQSAEMLAWHAAGRAFDLWQKKNFRSLTGFETVGKTEQDRIFNELEVTALGAIDLFFDWQMRQVTAKDDYRAFEFLRNELPIQFVLILEKNRLDKEMVQLWRELIKMRFSEYQDRLKDAELVNAHGQEFKDKPQFARPVWSRVQTLAICSWQHIRRGEGQEDDPLWPLLRNWLTDIYGQLMALMDAFVAEKMAGVESPKKRVN